MMNCRLPSPRSAEVDGYASAAQCSSASGLWVDERAREQLRDLVVATQVQQPVQLGRLEEHGGLQLDGVAHRGDAARERGACVLRGVAAFERTETGEGGEHLGH
ncbi:hypothetical protein T492DRAFT_1031572 [Pavlovales sp. CCMP2436]|nr:hypothetical protein T492DRAFT_1031572 [Pavlovales sp. CCMP2436]